MSSDNRTSHRRRRRRRRAEISSSNDEDDYYDDDSSDEEKAKKHEMYKGACSLGQFCLNPCLCLYMSCRQARHAIQSVGQRRRQASHHATPTTRTRRLWGGLLVSFIVCIVLFPRRNTHSRYIRHPNDSSLEQLPILVHRVSAANAAGVSSSQFPRLPPLKSPSKLSDHGGLFFASLRHADAWRRTIAHDDYERYEQVRLNEILQMDHKYYGEYYDHDDESIDLSCRRPNWKSLYFPNCNAFHEVDLSRDYNENQTSTELNFDSYIFNNGYYRDAWMLIQPHDDVAVLKSLRFKHNYNCKTRLQVQKDAIIMERFTSSANIIDMYGLCGTSVTVQPIPYNVEEYVVPGDGYLQPEELHDILDVKPQNTFTSTEKLHMALEMAESIAVLHGYEAGVVVHDDIQLCQWLRDSHDRLILGDFNRAEILSWNHKRHTYCTYKNGGAYGNYRSPEEIRDDYLDEQIDVYSFGNNLYGLLTGLWIFYDTDDDKTAQDMVTNGERAFIDERYRSRSFAEAKLVEVMELCWIDDPAERIDIFEAVRLLRKAVRKNKKLLEMQ